MLSALRQLFGVRRAATTEQLAFRDRMAQLLLHIGHELPAGAQLGLRDEQLIGALAGITFAKALHTRTALRGNLGHEDLHTLTIRLAFAAHALCAQAGAPLTVKIIQQALTFIDAKFANAPMAKEIVPLYVKQVTDIRALEGGEPAAEEILTLRFIKRRDRTVLFTLGAQLEREVMQERTVARQLLLDVFQNRRGPTKGLICNPNRAL
jgi:hypothetical protein